MHWVSPEEMQAQKIRHNIDLPMYVPRQRGPGFFNISDERAVRAGLTYRPLGRTLQDLVDGFRRHYPAGFTFGAPQCDVGLSPPREQETLRQLKRIT